MSGRPGAADLTTMISPIARKVAARFTPGTRVVATDGTRLVGNEQARRGTMEGAVVRHIPMNNGQGGIIVVDWDNGSRGRRSAGSLEVVESD